MEATNNNHNFSSIDLDGFVSFDNLYAQVNDALSTLIMYLTETDDAHLTKIVGEPLATLQYLMSKQMKDHEQSTNND